MSAGSWPGKDIQDRGWLVGGFHVGQDLDLTDVGPPNSVWRR